jgi:hypothetical protein
MKPLLILPVILLATGCISAAEFDRDKAYSECERYDDPSTKNRCIAKAIQDAERNRAGQTEDMKQREEDAEKRELGRVIAGVPQD